MPRETSKDSDKFSPKEVERRFEAALRGARIAGHKQMKDITKKSAAKRKKRV
jgi:hypothetical protein